MGSIGTSVFHHPALRVSELARAAQFYLDAFDGHWLTRPFVMEGEFAEQVMEGPKGVRFKVCHIGFEQGAVELFEFLEPVRPIKPIHPTEGNLIHFGLKVDDVPGTLARVEAAGGRRVWPEIASWGTAQVVYVKDLDENVLELTDASLERIVELTLEAFPDAAPGAA